MNEIPYESGSYYVFNRAYNNIKMLYRINQIEDYFRCPCKEELAIQGHQMEAKVAEKCSFGCNNRINGLLSKAILP